MRTSIYLSSGFITVVSGRMDEKTKLLTVTKKAYAPLPDGAVVNGVINDEEGLLAAFSQVVSDFGGLKHADLVLDTTHIVYRLSVLPAVGANEMKTLVRNEFVNRNMTEPKP